MTNRLILDGIVKAENILNEVEGVTLQERETLFDLADGVMVNIKAFVSNEEAWKKINEYEMKTHQEFAKRLNDARAKLKDIDPIYQWQKGLEFTMDLRFWKAREMLAFWDKITKEYDL